MKKTTLLLLLLSLVTVCEAQNKYCLSTKIVDFPAFPAI